MNSEETAIDLPRLPCRQFKDGVWRSFQDEAALEVPVTLALALSRDLPQALNLSLVSDMAPASDPTPPSGDGVLDHLWAFPDGLSELTLGHALLDHCPSGMVPTIAELGPRSYRATFSPGSPPPGLPWPGPLRPIDILSGATRFLAMAGRWDATGCFHRAALFDPTAKTFMHHVEDIGRHNCLDRLAGWALARGLPLGGRVLYVTARATASLTAKAVRSGYAVMVSRSAVTTAGVELAREAGLTLVGFSRENRFSVFIDIHGRIENL
jgi:FdhD protein